jgi:chromosome segregation ATPase
MYAKTSDRLLERHAKRSRGARLEVRTSMSTANTHDRQALIARAAYLRAEKRGFQGGDPVEDWLAAEAEIDTQLRAEREKEERRDFRRYTDGLREQIDTATVRLEELRDRASALRGEARQDWQRSVEEIKDRRDALETKLAELRKKGRKKRDELKQQAEQVLAELKRSLDKLHALSRDKRP